MSSSTSSPVLSELIRSARSSVRVSGRPSTADDHVAADRHALGLEVDVIVAGSQAGLLGGAAVLDLLDQRAAVHVGVDAGRQLGPQGQRRHSQVPVVDAPVVA